MSGHTARQVEGKKLMEGQAEIFFHWNLLATATGPTWVDKGKEKSRKS